MILSNYYEYSLCNMLITFKMVWDMGLYRHCSLFLFIYQVFWSWVKQRQLQNLHEIFHENFQTKLFSKLKPGLPFWQSYPPKMHFLLFSVTCADFPLKNKLILMPIKLSENQKYMKRLLLLLSRLSRVQLCATP